MRRKAGPDMVVWRRLEDGSLGCATPCVLCRKELERFDMRVCCVLDGGLWFRGRMGEEDAPQSKPTLGQKLRLFGGGAANGTTNGTTSGATPAITPGVGGGGGGGGSSSRGGNPGEGRGPTPPPGATAPASAAGGSRRGGAGTSKSHPSRR